MQQIFNGDARELFKNYSDNCFDCICSDVPYKIVTGGCRVKKQDNDCAGIFNRFAVDDRLKNKWLKKNAEEDNLTLIRKGKLFKHADIKFNEWLPEAYRVLKEGSHAYFMVNARNLKDLQTEAEKVRFKFQNLLIWVKNTATPHHTYMQQCEFILMLRKGKERYINNMGNTNIFSYNNIIGNKFHPTEKPIQLMKDLILNSTNENDIVLDPFMGAGSTILACKECNRRAVGFEIDERYYNIAQERLNSVMVQRNGDEKQMGLFD